MKYALLVHLAATLVMVGVIWFVQIVHYPLFSRVGSGGFALYSDAHSRLTTYVVGPPMLTEVATALLLVFRPPRTFCRLLLSSGSPSLGSCGFRSRCCRYRATPRSAPDSTTRPGAVSSSPTGYAPSPGARGLLVLWMTTRLIG